MAKKKGRGPHGDPMGCPARDCSGGRAERQYQINDAQFERLSEKSQAVIGDNSSPIYRCVYCDCVYIQSHNPAIPPTILEFLK
jgi:hypothetical protein